MNADSLERIVPDNLTEDEVTGKETYQLHIKRYEFAANYLKGQVLDAACGVGYGSYFLAESGKVEGIDSVDINVNTINYAKKRYAHSLIIFHCRDILSFKKNDLFDTIISLETIEHVADPENLIRHFFSLLKPGGIFIGSVPVTPSVDANPHHVNDFTASGFKKMLIQVGLKVEQEMLQVQPFSPVKILNGKEQRAKNIRPNLIHYYYKNPHSLFSRIWSLLRYGFTNRYLTVQCTKPLK